MIQALKYLRCHQPTPSTVMAAPAVTNTASSFVRCLSIAYLVYVLKYKTIMVMAWLISQSGMEGKRGCNRMPCYTLSLDFTSFYQQCVTDVHRNKKCMLDGSL